MKPLMLASVFLFCASSFGRPHWDREKLPRDASYSFFKPLDHYRIAASGLKILSQSAKQSENLRITVHWEQKTGLFTVTRMVLENTGTESLIIRSKKQPLWGSFHAKIQTHSGQETYFDSIGTGQVYKNISNNMSFRFPVPNEDFTFILSAENSLTGNQEVVLVGQGRLSEISGRSKNNTPSEFFTLKSATKSPSLEFVIFAEGFESIRKEYFLQSALRTVDILRSIGFPHFERINFRAVFKKSNLPLGQAIDYGSVPIKRDSAYGLYYLHWHKFGRWYHVIYPTDEEYFRSSMSEFPYDYNLFLVDSSEFWGVGNYKTHTAVPVGSNNFTYLLLHELGHYFGLNEEYDGGGPTELEFAKGIYEAWSQNMTFLPIPTLKHLKWRGLISDRDTPIPSPNSFWNNDKYGAYEGGYADSNENRSSFKPGLSCVMDSGTEFCKVCLQGIADVIKFDLGL